jgi:hypothetical protein
MPDLYVSSTARSTEALGRRDADDTPREARAIGVVVLETML